MNLRFLNTKSTYYLILMIKYRLIWRVHAHTHMCAHGTVILHCGEISTHRDHHVSRVFKSLTRWLREQEHFDIFIAVICPRWIEMPGLCWSTCDVNVCSSVCVCVCVRVEPCNIPVSHRNSSCVRDKFFPSCLFFFFADFVHVWVRMSLCINLLESHCRLPRAWTAVLGRSSSHECLILALRLNRPASILPAQLAACGIFPHVGFSTAEEMV